MASSATYEDVINVPENVVAELIDGTLYSGPRPPPRHMRASTMLINELVATFDRGLGGWLLLYSPELHLGRQVLVPDLAGWRRERMPEMPDATGVTLAPDWLCEVLSPSTASVDRSVKLPKYAAHGVAWVWFLDPLEKTLEILRLDGRTYRVVGSHSGDGAVRAEPFDAIELELSALWSR